MSSIDIAAVVKEMGQAVGARVDKVYHPSPDHLVLALRAQGEGRSFVHFHVGRWLYLSKNAHEMPQRPSDFAMMLRKRITNARVASVRQQGFDRIAVFSLEKEETFELVLELFGEGNAILVKDGVIVQPLTSHTWKHRDVRAKKPFAFPPPVPDPDGMDPQTLLAVFKESDADVVRTLATRLNIGGRYSEEICARAGMPKGRPAAELTQAECEAILGTIKAVKAEATASGKGYIVLKDQAVEDVVPLKMAIYEGMAQEEFPSYSSAVESYIARLPEPAPQRPREAVLELERLRRKLTQQEGAATKLRDDAREMQLKGDLVFAEYAEVARILSMARDVLLSSEDLSGLPGFVAYDRKASLLRVRVGSAEIDLDPRKSVEENAQRYYEEAKRARRKLESVLAAAQETRREIELQERSMAEPQERPESRRKPTKRFWFERFRWFVSSEGALVLGGKDARSNDLLVKKHLDPGDRYAHADVHGAPSVVVKMKEGVTEATLREACEFAVATSRAWNAKVGSAAGYWVLPEQVSKSPQSGEYLAKGAFVIRGKRNYSEKLEIKLAVGEIVFEGYRKIMCGPVSAVKANSKRYVVIRPGEMDKEELAKRLSDAFGVPIEEIQSILPPGDVEVVEQVGLAIT